MKFKYLNMAVFSLIMVPSVFARSVQIPALERVRKQVDEALKKGSSAVSTQGNNILTALGMKHDSNPLHDAEKILEALNWSKESDVVTMLLNLKKESAIQAAQFLKDVINKKCTGTKSPLITFAHQLADEEHKLQDVFNLLLKSLDAKRVEGLNATQSRDKVKMLFDQHAQLAQNLQQLIDVTNTLLMS